MNNIIIFGEVLWDIFPDGRRTLGGAPFNVAWHLQAFGVTPLLISRVGQDPLGDTIQQTMADWGMSLQGLQSDAQYPTGTVEIQLHQGDAHYNIRADSAYDFIDPQACPKLPPDSLLYHGSLALRNPQSLASHQQLYQQVDNIFFDINLRAPWWTADAIAISLAKTRYLKLNTDELTIISDSDSSPESAIAQLFGQKHLEAILLTKGAAGASLYLRTGDRLDIVPQLQKMTVVDTVGAGDAFCSVFLLGLYQHWPFALTLERAQAFASAIVGIRGATVQDRGFYQKFMEAWQL